MSSFFENIPYEDAEQIDRTIKFMYELRESRQRLLEQHGVESEDQIKQSLVEMRVAEHPTYEDYLSASILEKARLTIRQELKSYLKEL